MTELAGKPADYFIGRLCDLGRRLRQAVVASRGRGNHLSGVARRTISDTIYSLDTQVEPELEHFCGQWGKELPLLLIAEGVMQQGMPEGQACFPPGIQPQQAAFQLIVDPVDGTRGLMYDKRSAWVLAGIAPNLPNPRLSDIRFAAQVEIPTSKQILSDVLWAARGGGAAGRREHIQTGESAALTLSPSQAVDLSHGFGSVVSFFPGSKILSARLLEYIAQGINGPPDPAQPLLFDDQYISTGGQLYEILMGHDRFVIDIRPDLDRLAGNPPGLSAHPYDLATALIAAEAGACLTDGRGRPLDAPLDVHTCVSWAAYANKVLADKIERLTRAFFHDRAPGTAPSAAAAP